MSIADLRAGLDLDRLGASLYALIEELYPICRSITGNGVRQTLARLATLIPIQVREVPSGTRVLDWTVPREWNIRDAYVKNGRGERVIDFQRSNLHVVSYSVPVQRRMPLRELKEHLFTLPEHPDWIPYRTSYYRETWGFCLSHSSLLALPDEEYEVCIDATLEDGFLTFGEVLLEGDEQDEVLVSTHICHPSLCNDNLSGIVVTAYLAKLLSDLPRRYSYRFLFIPGTIGSITWLALNESRVSRIRHGLVAACLGDPGGFTYKKSRRGDAEIDRTVQHVLQHSNVPFQIVDFSPYGYDERQYCSPGFNLPVGVLSRTPHGRFPEYHTSADNLSLVRPRALAESLSVFLGVCEVLEGNRRYLNLYPKGEPQLGRRGLYGPLGGVTSGRTWEMALLWVLNLSDGAHSLLDVAARSGLPFGVVREAAESLATHGLLGDAPQPSVAEEGLAWRGSPGTSPS
jgi:aminopeptidase-like protein